MNRYLVRLSLFFISFLYSYDMLSSSANIKNTVKNILVFCPANLVTGGTEALCQLFYELDQLGFRTNMFH